MPRQMAEPCQAVFQLGYCVHLPLPVFLSIPYIPLISLSGAPQPPHPSNATLHSPPFCSYPKIYMYVWRFGAKSLQ